jgi:2-aminoethylphosphonate-pyruvate transaminase
MSVQPEPGLTLLTPGPAGTSAQVRQAMLRGDLCHREPEFSELLDRLRTALPACLNLAGTHEATIVTGSGTAAMEMAVLSSVRAGRTLLVIRNGVYGERFQRIAEAHGITTTVVDAPWTRPADPEAVRRALAAGPGIDAVVCVHHETTTGLLNPIEAIGAVVRESGTLFVVDAISSTAIEAPDLPLAGADVICGTANKGLHGIPGVAFLLFSADKGIDRLFAVPRRSLYLDAATLLTGQRNGNVPFTPAIQACYALDQAISEYLAAGGYAARLGEYRRRATLVRDGLARIGLAILIDEEYRANSVTTIELPAGIGYRPMHDELKRRGYVVYAGLGPLSDTHFRIATMGEIRGEALAGLEPALAESLRVLRRPGAKVA